MNYVQNQVKIMQEIPCETEIITCTTCEMWKTFETTYEVSKNHISKSIHPYFYCTFYPTQGRRESGALE